MKLTVLEDIAREVGWVKVPVAPFDEKEWKLADPPMLYVKRVPDPQQRGRNHPRLGFEYWHRDEWGANRELSREDAERLVDG